MQQLLIKETYCAFSFFVLPTVLSVLVHVKALES